ncbi:MULTISPECIES: NUDIX domain-containing protein [Polymorphospora]|uniref:NUDIX domain-containing protein n=1 Tax=Polymorphospora lycopeni TaxID=3140240 RepID=A0ABV5CUD4_9ACTN
MQSYAVLYEPSGRFLIATKFDLGYFFFEHGVGQIKTAGQVLNGAGKAALPGGRIDGNESIAAAARREFREETGVDIATAAPTVQVAQHSFGAYGAGYFRVSAAEFNTLAMRIATVTLPAGEQAAAAIRNGTINNYAGVHARFPAAPPSNELRYSYTWNVTDPMDWQQIQQLQHDRDTNWYYTVLLHLRVNLIGVAVS